MMICGGRRLPAVNMISSRMFSLKLKRENANPSIDEIHRMRIRAGTTMMSVFRKKCGSSACVPGGDEVVEVQRLRERDVAVDDACRRSAGTPCRRPTPAGTARAATWR